MSLLRLLNFCNSARKNSVFPVLSILRTKRSKSKRTHADGFEHCLCAAAEVAVYINPFSLYTYIYIYYIHTEMRQNDLSLAPRGMCVSVCELKGLEKTQTRKFCPVLCLTHKRAPRALPTAAINRITRARTTLAAAAVYIMRIYSLYIYIYIIYIIINVCACVRINADDIVWGPIEIYTLQTLTKQLRKCV